MAIDVPLDQDYEQELAEAWNDIDGEELYPEMERKARALQMEWCRTMNVHEKRPIDVCVDKTKKPPIKVKWIDHNKGDRQNMSVWSTLVAKQINTGKETRSVRGDAATRGFADAAIGDGHWEQVQGVDV